MKDILKKNYIDGNDIFGYPQKYKNIELYPIKLKDTKYQSLFYAIFAHPKNYIPDYDILKSSYLKFLICVVQPSVKDSSLDDFIDMMKYLTKKDVILLSRETGKDGLGGIDLQLKIGDDIFEESDFDNIREIVLQQQGLSIEYIEEYNPELEQSLMFMNRNSSDITMEDEIFTFCAVMKMGIKEVEDYTLYQFKIAMEKLLILKEYDLYKPLITSGEITLKTGTLQNYFYHSSRKGRYDSIKVDMDDFDNSDVMKASKTIN